MSGSFTFADWFVLGVGADIAGAITLAWSFILTSPGSIAEEILLPLRTYGWLRGGFGAFARSLARQRAEARVGGVFLVTGFGAQLVAYLFSNGSAHFTTEQERIASIVLVLAEWGVAAVVWKTYVPRSAARIFRAAHEAQEADVARRVAESQAAEDAEATDL